MQVLSVSLSQVTKFCGDYREAIVAYKGQHFTDRSLVSTPTTRTCSLQGW